MTCLLSGDVGSAADLCNIYNYGSTFLGRLGHTWTNLHDCSVQFPPTGHHEYIPLCTVCVYASPPLFLPPVQFVHFCSTIDAFSLPVSEIPSDCRCSPPEEPSSASFYCTI